ncbi:lipid-A-disaccharide synthase N-terminal domain-containing protein [Candidatus Woesearchaeota archaeon]|nr:lipid-A-disaccharide synthase N-terminal domain-containing protein [Candidatus Woesearchaeota archaeon]
MADSLIGLAGGFIFFSSWIVQFYETKKAKKPIYSQKFVWLRIIGCLLLMVEAVRVESIAFFLMYFATGIMMVYSLTKMKDHKTKGYF